jgi:hypothetical protein
MCCVREYFCEVQYIYTVNSSFNYGCFRVVQLFISWKWHQNVHVDDSAGVLTTLNIRYFINKYKSSEEVVLLN